MDYDDDDDDDEKQEIVVEQYLKCCAYYYYLVGLRTSMWLDIIATTVSQPFIVVKQSMTSQAWLTADQQTSCFATNSQKNNVPYWHDLSTVTKLINWGIAKENPRQMSLINQIEIA